MSSPDLKSNKMSVLEINKNFEKNVSGKHLIKMNSKAVRELRSIAKDKGLNGYFKLKKDDLVALLLEQSSEKMPTSPPRASGKEKRCALPVKTVSSPQEMDEFEKEEMKKSRSVVKAWYDWLVDYVRKPIKNTVSKALSKPKNSMLRLYDGAKKTLQGDVEAEAEKKNQEEEDIDLTPHEHERTLKGAYRSFLIPGHQKKILILF